MTNDRQLERLLDAWFTEGPTMAPDRVIDDVAARITRQRQQPAWRLRSWRFPDMSTPLKLVLIGAALLAALVAGSIIVGAGGQPAVAPPSPSPTPELPAFTQGKLEAGTYVAHPLPGDPMTWTITVPAGWVGYDDWLVYADVPEGDPGVIAGGPTANESIPVDSCDAAGTTPAASVDEFIAAVQARDDWTVSAPVDVTVSGYSGTRIDLEVPADITCENGNDYMVLSLADGTGFNAQDPSSRFRLWILDVEGVPLPLFRQSFADSPAELVAQGDAIVTTSVLTP